MRWREIAVVAFLASPALARDNGQWENSPNSPEVKQWFKSLMRPDYPKQACCGEADAYWCDHIRTTSTQTFCKITDTRDDAPLKRPHVPIGTEFEIPIAKYKHDRSNPTGHSVLFLSGTGIVYCFVQTALT